jgi:hypothetical protein
VTSPQSDPVSDVGAAIARLTESFVGAHRRIDNLEKHLSTQMDSERRHVATQLEAAESLTDAKFVTFRTLVDGQAEQVKLALDASDKAIGKAEIANEKRFDSVNEFRQTLTDQAGTFMPRKEVEQIAATYSARMQDLATAGQHWITRDEQAATIARLNDRIQELTEWRLRTESKGEGAKDNRSGVFAVVAVAVSLLTAVILVANFLT